MGIFDVFSGAPQRQAAQWTTNYLTNLNTDLGGKLQTGADTANNALTTGANTATGLYSGALPQQLGAIGQGTQAAQGDLYSFNPAQARTDLSGYGDAALAELTATGNAARGSLQNGVDLFNPYAQGGQQGFSAYLNSLGLNGASGNAAAQSMFQAGPGYQWNVDQATDQVNRAANKSGQLYGGNTLTALQDRASNLANQEYGNWQNRLQGVGQMGFNATGQQQQGLTGIANLDQSLGTSKAGILSGMGSGLSAAEQAAQASRVAQGNTMAGYDVQAGRDRANLIGSNTTGQAGVATGLGTGTSANDMSLAQLLANMGMTTGNGIVNAQQSAFTADQQAGSNVLSTLLGIGKLGTSIYGASMGAPARA